MLQYLLSIDYWLYTVMNSFPRTSFLNSFFSFLSGVGSWGVVWVILGAVLIVREKLENKKHLLPLIFSIIFSLLLSELVIKNVIQRERPAGGLGTYSFPSSHATIAFAAAYVLSRCHGRWRVAYYSLAVLISFSRVYLERHYPADLLAGMLLGTLIGYISVRTKIS